MTWDYVSGFFDADGCITLSTYRKNDPVKTVYVSFDNTQREILETIREFILEQTGHAASICAKPPRKENHSVSYVLKYDHVNKCEDIIKHMSCAHPIKRRKIELVLSRMRKLTPRNGKYTEQLIADRLAFEQEFFQ
jgi:intein-encoded DNA endonuclease-like protein